MDVGEPVLALCGGAEEGPACITSQTINEVANRSQQTHLVWSKRALAQILKSPAQKSKISINTENKSVNGIERQISDICPETTKRWPTRQASRHGRNKPT